MKTVRFFFLFVCVSCLIAVCSGCMSTAAHYRRFQDRESLFAVLNAQIKPGAGREGVFALLGEKTYHNEAHLQGVFGLYKQKPNEFPQGLKKDDTIIFYPHGEHGLVRLIFRKGALINYNPQKYKE
ncbi:MAG: hypothetical protein KAH23_10280 [Kiritimatiellae bacterium]|nr:hypothetical protein [Kiritimatiellia bacterium]